MPRITVAYLLEVLQGLPEDTLVVPDWFAIPGDDQPAVRLHGILYNPADKLVKLKVSLVDLEDIDDEDDELDPDQE